MIKINHLTQLIGGLVLLFSFNASAQFQMRYGTPDTEYFRPFGMDIVSDQGYIVSGHHKLNLIRSTLMKMKKEGSLEWSLVYDFPSGAYSQGFRDAQEISWMPGNYHTIGSIHGGTGFSNADLFFMAVRKNGSPLIAYRLGTSLLDVGVGVRSFSHPLLGNAFAIAGYGVNGLSSDPNQEIDVELVMINRAGNILQGGQFHYEGKQYLKTFEKTENGEFILAGETNVEVCDSLKKSIFVIKFNQNMFPVWHQVIDLNPLIGSNDVAESIEVIGKRIYLSGHSTYSKGGVTHQQPFLMEIRPNGLVSWVKSYDMVGFTNGRSYSLTSAVDAAGDIKHAIACEVISSSDPYLQASIIETDGAGKVNWAKRYPSSYQLSSTYANKIVRNEIGGYTFTGPWFDALGPFTSYKTQLVKTKAFGETGENCVEPIEVIEQAVAYCQRRLPLIDIFPIQSQREEVKVYDNPVVITKCVEDAMATSKNPNSSGNLVNLSPVPARDFVKVKSETPVQAIRILDFAGNPLADLPQIKSADVPVSSLQSGVYILEMTLEDGTVERQKFIKE